MIRSFYRLTWFVRGDVIDPIRGPRVDCNLAPPPGGVDHFEEPQDFVIFQHITGQPLSLRRSLKAV